MTQRVCSADTSRSRWPDRGQISASKWMVVAALLYAFAVPCSWGEQPYTPQAKEYLRKLDEPIVLRGDYFRAAMVAYKDFLHSRLAKNAKLANAYSANGQVPSRNADVYTMLSKIENFDMHIQQSDSTYTVEIGPTLRGDMPLMFGGGMIYEIDKKTFAITSKSHLK
jgi:hypothetical protein